MKPLLPSVRRWRHLLRGALVVVSLTAGVFTAHMVGAPQASAQACIPFRAACYHEVAGVRYGTLKRCMKAGSTYIPNVAAIGWYKCVAEQPSGWEYLYIWSFRCPQGMTYQWCAAHHKL